ncbi:zeta toxin family protein [Methylobacter sp. S3L5C]|uniref:zeta toxin family protein n=1 Tax=Methylobacter sp. S3L5C TaxID=2839024 RepID=UPI001FAD28FA|nr:zeta toxin family protein [Methylobacter sp. S3L5C]UOA07983.1 zeta toxin family protein [Methylobacter sp. S3L5C]
MTKSTVPGVAGYKQLKKLRTALAIYQGLQLLPTLLQEAEGTVSHDQTKRVTYLTELFSRIHREIFQDWKEQPTVCHRPGTMLDADKRKEFRETIECLVLDDDGNLDTAIFDNNGFVIKTEDIAERLATFYQKMRGVRPFTYGNRLTLDLFLTMLGKLPAIKSVYEQGIDFRRIEACDAAALHNPDSTLREITQAFEHALDPTRCKSLQNKANAYGKWPENKKFVYGIPFLSHTTKTGIECLVAVNGGLIPMDSIKKEYFIAGKHFADYPLCAAENMIGYLAGTEAVRHSGNYEIDGISMGEDGAAPLFCLDINMLTGLRSPGHTEVLQLLKQCEGDKALIFNLAKNEALKDKMITAANGDLRLERAVEIAYERLSKIIKKLDEAKDKLFKGKIADTNPTLFMAMGGAGSGKTAVEEIAQIQCRDNFVIASLDEFRKKSDLYKILTAASHHSDDYVYVEPFANRLRDLVADHAKKNNINILYDGTGIPYQPRYSNIINQFKEYGFHTQITAVDAFVIKPQGRENELIRSNVITSVKERFETTARALPWVVTVDKHIRAPRSFLNALEHEDLDKISLFANDSEKDRHYLVAESFPFSVQDIKALQKHQIAGTLMTYLKQLIRNREDSILKNLAQGDENLLEALINRNTVFTENNVAFQIYPGKNRHRVLVIYNTRRMVDFVEKRQLNPNASGEEGLLHKPESLAFHVDPYTKDPWMTRLQD